MVVRVLHGGEKGDLGVCSNAVVWLLWFVVARVVLGRVYCCTVNEEATDCSLPSVCLQ